MKQKTVTDLNKIYSEAEEVDRELFAEMRSNILLVAGEHYSKVSARIASQIRQTNKVNANDQKLRLTKNHMHRAHRAYVTAILNEAPGTTVSPQRDTELQDQKDAELNLAVWQDVKNRHKLKQKVKDYCSSFVGIGEVCVKCFWDPMAGEFLGYEQAVDPETGEIMMEPTDQVDPMTGMPVMQPALDIEKPIFSGDFVFEEIYGFNLLREAGTQDMHEHGRAWIVRKMVPVDELKMRYKDNEEIYNKLSDTSDETYVVFDINKGSYNKKKGETVVREYYWAPCAEYPQGYFMYATKEVVLEEGELPFGIFPLVWAGMDKYATTPRGRSILKVARPYQAEINRASSSMATAQVTMGDDKIIYQAGAKMAPGALLPGVRGIAIQGGATPTILPGRSGAQYLDYVAAQVMELDSVLMLEETRNPDKSSQVDPWAMLYKAASQRKKYSIYSEKFEQFLCDLTELVLKLAKHYLPDDMLIPAVGSREIVNIAEFRKTTPLSYQVKIEPQTENVETKFGKQMFAQQILQYVGKQLDPKVIGKIIKNMPFGNSDDSFDDLTLDEDIAKNDMLALERGEQVQPFPYVDPDFMIKKFTKRMKSPEFKFFDQAIQQNYQMLVQQYEQIFAAQQQKIIAAKNEYIPVDGTLVTCDIYVPDPTHPENQARRARLPQRALEWLMKRLEEQGMTMDKLEGMNAQALSDMATMILTQQQAAAPQMQGVM